MISRVSTLGFWLALATTLVFAWTPHPPQLFSNDKSQHQLAFFVLTILGGLAFPTRRLIILGGALAVIGGIIELVQAIPAIHRDCDIYDWYADVEAILVGLIAVQVPRLVLRRWHRVGGKIDTTEA